MMKGMTWALICALLLASSACTEAPQGVDERASDYETRASDGPIAFRLTPNRSGARLIVDVQADTHSGDLSDVDLSRHVTLVADGRVYRPADATVLSGHHSRGTVAFDVPDPLDGFAVVIASVRGMEEMTFEWP